MSSSEFANAFEITQVGLDSNTQYTVANGFGTIAGGFSNMSLLLFIKDNAT